jgi:von Willebrand factor type A domain
MDGQTGFTLAVSQNKYLSTPDREVHAIVTVTARDRPDAAPEVPAAAVVIAVDCSGSMSNPPTKISAARHASAAAVDAVRDGAYFAVVEGTHIARMIYPPEREMVAATPRTRKAAKAAVRRLAASGGTCMSTWLSLARQLLAAHPGAVRQLILLTDGQNVAQDRSNLTDVLAACAGEFCCDGRGIGADYAPEELRRIASTLTGTADAILDEADLVGDFTALMRTAMGKAVPDVQLLVRTMPFARLRFVRQRYPTDAELAALRVDERTAAFPTGSWARGEEREFQLCLTVTADEPLAMREDIQVARVDITVSRDGGEAEPCAEPGVIAAHWTEDSVLSSAVEPKRSHYDDQTELDQAVLAGFNAHNAGDLAGAGAEWGRAVAIATRLGHDAMLTRLTRLVDVPGSHGDGVALLRPDVSPQEIFSVVMGSSVAVRSPQAPPGPTDGGTAPGDRTCPECGYVLPGVSAFCASCGHRLAERR